MLYVILTLERNYQFYKFVSLLDFNLHMILTYKYMCYINVNFCDTSPNFL